MPESGTGNSASGVFDRAVRSMREAKLRPELTVAELPAPAGLAPDAFALTADVRPAIHGADSVYGTGRIVLLHDAEEPEAWGGPFRIVAFAQGPLETEIGLDPFVADVAWSWLIDALEARNANYAAASGTATKAISTGYGELGGQGDVAQLELRASWSPRDHRIAAHVEAWSDLLSLLAGLPPEGDAVPLLPRRGHRGARG